MDERVGGGGEDHLGVQQSQPGRDLPSLGDAGGARDLPERQAFVGQNEGEQVRGQVGGWGTGGGSAGVVVP